MLNKNAVGNSCAPALNEVERGAIRRFAEAMGDYNPAHYDDEYARTLGYPGVLAPPTFPASFHSNADLQAMLGVNIKSLLHTEQTFEYERPIFAGDCIWVVTRVVDVFDRPGLGSRVNMAVLEDEGRDENGLVVFRARRTLVVRASKEVSQ